MKKSIKFLLLSFAAMMTVSCSGLLDTDSEIVEFQKDHTLNSPTDSIYSVMGIISKMQVIADRTVLLGDIRSDLTATTSYANSDLKSLAAFEAQPGSRYNQISDYYAVINNCNDYLATVDTTLTKRNRKIFEQEFAAVKTFRAWTYLQTVLAYGNIPLVTKPIMTELEAEEAMSQNPSDIKAICNYFIDDLKPYIDTHIPEWGAMDGRASSQFFIPVRVMLAELCLWAERYQEAAEYYHEFFSPTNASRSPYFTGTNRMYWNEQSSKFTDGIWGTINYQSSSEAFCYIPMESREYDGIVSDLGNIYNSTVKNNYYAQAGPSKALFDLSKAQDYCLRFQMADGTYDTLFAPKQDLLYRYAEGDLRLFETYSMNKVNRNLSSPYSNEVQYISKHLSVTTEVPFFRTTVLYLHYAECLNRLGYCQSAFAILKYGLIDKNIKDDKIISPEEREAAGNFLNFDINVFKEDNTQPIHRRGCGDVRCDNGYAIPATCVTKEDSIKAVEDYIVNELALETAFEGHRYYDLLRVALRRNAPEYLAEPISRRNGTEDAALKAKLMDPANWYLAK